MIAFEEAYLAGADGIELDVRLSKDGEVVIFHDEKIDRLTGGKGRLNDFTLNELQTYPISHPLLKASERQVIPTLKDYLAWAKYKPLLTNIELKSVENNYRLELRVAEMLLEFDMEERVILSSFSENSLTRIKVLLSKVKTGLLLSKYDEATVKRASERGVDFLHLKANRMNPTVIGSAKAYGLGINTWTVNEHAELEKVNQLGLKGIITDFPDRLKKIQAGQ